MTKRWFPQREIFYISRSEKLLAQTTKWKREILFSVHSNVKLFISHGGIFGIYEAIDASVPVLGIPLYYDQPRNVDNLVDAEMTLSMYVLTMTRN